MSRPSLRPHYTGIAATTGRSAGARRDGTQHLAVSAAWCAPSRARSLRAQCQRAPSRVSAREPQTGLAPPARRAPPGQQYGHSARLIPGRALSPRFRCRLLISTLQRWFTHVRLPGPRLTALTPPFPHRSAPQSSARAPCGGLTPPPAGRRRRATKPSSRVQQASVIASYRGRLLSAHTAQNAVKLRLSWVASTDRSPSPPTTSYQFRCHISDKPVTRMTETDRKSKK